jgi:hypothetical protein
MQENLSPRPAINVYRNQFENIWVHVFLLSSKRRGWLLAMENRLSSNIPFAIKRWVASEN